MFTINGDVVTVTTPSDCRWLQVEFRPHGAGEEQDDRRKVKVPATGNMVGVFCLAVYFYYVVVISTNVVLMCFSTSCSVK